MYRFGENCQSTKEIYDYLLTTTLRHWPVIAGKKSYMMKKKINDGTNICSSNWMTTISMSCTNIEMNEVKLFHTTHTTDWKFRNLQASNNKIFL